MASQSLTRCFAQPQSRHHSHSTANRRRIQLWLQQTHFQSHHYCAEQQQILASLIPLLLCGEQSAQLVFNQQINQLAEHTQQHPIIKTLIEVEHDELMHDMALQSVLSQLSQAKPDQRSQRLGQRFYSHLGRVDSLAQQFVRISVLDSCVTLIMQQFEHCRLGKQHPFAQLCGLIKKDEAKHVYISKHYAKSLGATAELFANEKHYIHTQLQQLLSQRDRQFELLAIDLDKLFKQIEA